MPTPRRPIAANFALSIAALLTACAPGYRYNRTARHYAGNIPFTIVNDTGITACYVHMSPSNDRRWGSDWLGPSETIPPGGARTFAIAGGPAWDVQVVTCDHQILGEARQVPIMAPMQVGVSRLQPGAAWVPGQQVVVQPAPDQPVVVQPAPDQPMQKEMPSSGN